LCHHQIDLRELKIHISQSISLKKQIPYGSIIYKDIPTWEKQSIAVSMLQFLLVLGLVGWTCAQNETPPGKSLNHVQRSIYGFLFKV